MSTLHSFCYSLLVILQISETHQTNCTFCVTGERSNECSTSQTSLQNLTSIKFESCNSTYIQLSSGHHYLDGKFELRNNIINHLEIRGSEHSFSIVECQMDSFFLFSSLKHPRIKSVSILNITFQSCGGSYNKYQKSAFFFIAVNFEMHLVVIKNSTGCGVLASRCTKTAVHQCMFSKNSGSHFKVEYKAMKKQNINMAVSQSRFYEGGSRVQSAALDVYATESTGKLEINITNCKFESNGNSISVKRGGNYNSKSNWAKIYLDITNCSFTKGVGPKKKFEIVATSKDDRNFFEVRVLNCSLVGNSNGGISLVDIMTASIQNCSIKHNIGIGLQVNVHSKNESTTRISECHFENNSLSLSLSLNLTSSNANATQLTVVSRCKFVNHKYFREEGLVVRAEGNPCYPSKETMSKGYVKNRIIIEKCCFEGNTETYRNCSSLFVKKFDNITLKDVSFVSNNCTGIILRASHLTVHGQLNFTENAGIFGGALRLDHMADLVKAKMKGTHTASISLKTGSQVRLFNNSADIYGGGIFVDETCEDRISDTCFLQTESYSKKMLYFGGNTAEIGGDNIFGGCLSNCSFNHDSVWDVMQFGKVFSQSSVADFPSQVMFCDASAPTNTTYSSRCKGEHSVNVFRGEHFNISLMVVDSFCQPSLGVIRADFLTTSPESAQLLGEGKFRLSSKNCRNYTYTLQSSEDTDSVKLRLVPYQEHLTSNSYQLERLISNNSLLTVNFTACPFGLVPRDQSCDCSGVLLKRGIECFGSNYSLKVPGSKWIGLIRKGKNKTMDLAIQPYYCRYCKREGTVLLTNAKEVKSDALCSQNRTGILCSSCLPGYSLKLGIGYLCSSCSLLPLRGIAFMLLFAAFGILLVAVLLLLNLTISTGLLSGLIFYSNIVYANGDHYLPISVNTSHLQGVINFLSVFQAWLNLDFGITTCFFKGLDTYIVTWLQFIFPVYIWVLILVIIIASRYSSTISRLTASNTVSVLATLFLLSYTKLLLTIITALSFTRLHFLNGASSDPVWVSDANILYATGKHIPLLLMSTVMVLFYIVPFTLLISLGYFMQAKSEWQVFSWINKIKPFLDAFYGPYAKKYRFWPGLLLLARLVVFSTFAFYSLGDGTFKLALIVVTIVFLLATWLLIGKVYKASLYEEKKLNYLEFFFLVNLLVYSVLTFYYQSSRDVSRQHLLSLMMVGSVFVVFCGVFFYRVIHTASGWKLIREFRTRFLPNAKFDRLLSLPSAMVRWFGVRRDDFKADGSEVDQGDTLLGNIQLQEITDNSSELREPLLTNN